MLPPGPSDAPEKQTFRWFATPYDLLRECAAKFGDPFTLRLSDYGEHVCTSDPDAIRTVFTAPAGVLDAGAGNDPLRPLLGDRSLLLLDGADHRRHRKILTAAFAEDRIARSAPAIDAITDRALADWSEGRTVSVHPAMVRISLEVILEFVLGRADEELARSFTELLQRPSLSLKLFEGSDPIRRRIDEVLFAKIRSEDRGGVLELLLGELDEEEIRDELVTLIVAGHETTASSLAWATFFILHTPGALERIAEPAHLEAACKETLRMRPVIPVVSRRVAQPIEVAGHRISPGLHVMPCIYLTHHRADLYPEPEEFRPERFFASKPSPYEYLPFGGGARRCIGMSFAMFEMQRVLSRMLSLVELELVDREPPRPIRSALMIVPSGGTRVRVKRRR